jgi:histidinol dehydrogenase
VDLRGFRGDLRDRLPSPQVVDDGPAVKRVRDILTDVRTQGDAALVELTEQLDGVSLEAGAIRVPDAAVKAALERIPADLRLALEAAHSNIFDYHRSQLHPDGDYHRRGVRVRELRRPVDRAGLYVPGGRAPLASTVLMTAAPARVAGVGELAMCSPPGPDGLPATAVLAAAAIAGVDEVYAVGGAQAIAALAYGTETVSSVDVIVGPGNRYVAIAERQVAGEGAVGVPSAFTGPSEVAVVADDTTEPAFAAIDLVVQAEHGPDGLAYLITWSEAAARAIGEEVQRIAAASPRRAEIEATLAHGGYSVIVEDAAQAMGVANAVAAEHLEIMCRDPESLVAAIRNAGAVFLGPWAPASAGDYVAGPNHVLPTARSARFGSALRVADFCKYIHVVDIDRGGLAGLAPHIEAMARSEGLAAHGESVRARLP